MRWHRSRFDLPKDPATAPAGHPGVIDAVEREASSRLQSTRFMPTWEAVKPRRS